jgi:hypothetical protein
MGAGLSASHPTSIGIGIRIRICVAARPDRGNLAGTFHRGKTTILL